MRKSCTWILGALIVFSPWLHAQATTPDSPEVAKIRQIESDWSQALVKKDQYALDLALSPTYVDISASGEVTTKNQQIAHLFAADYALLSYDETLTSVRVLGDTALAQGTYKLRRKLGSEVEEERGIFTHVYQHVRDTWQCINSQRTVVREQAGPPRASERKSEFHVPFMGHKKSSADDTSNVTVVQPAATPAQPAQPTPVPVPVPENAAPPPALENVQ